MISARYPYFLAGQPVTTADGWEVRDKYSGKVAATVSRADRAAVEAAIRAGQAAVQAMRRLPPFTRQTILEHCVTRFRDRAEELAGVLAVEAGKPLRDSRGEVTRLIDTFRVAAEESVRIGGEVLNLEISRRAAGYRGFTRRVPVGVCSFITPFNFPLNLVAHKIAPAIAAGCPFILKPSDRTPVSAMILGEVLAETELPPGAFSILTCEVADLAPLVEDDRIALLSFTGSAPVGWNLKARAGRKKVVLELGGNAACIVDADQKEQLDAIADRLVFGAYYQSGQSCISVQRIMVHRSLEAALTERLLSRVRALKAGDPRDESTTLGPMIDEAAAKRLEGWISGAVQAGARLLCGGKRDGAMLEAALLSHVPTNQPLYREEAFGPVALLQSFDDFDQALAMVNDSAFGLQAGVFTNNLSHALRAWDELEVGGVIVGDVPSFRVDNMPYGGVKGSGLGREGIRSAIADMTEERLLVLKQ